MEIITIPQIIHVCPVAQDTYNYTYQTVAQITTLPSLASCNVHHHSTPTKMPPNTFASSVPALASPAFPIMSALAATFPYYTMRSIIPACKSALIPIITRTTYAFLA